MPKPIIYDEETGKVFRVFKKGMKETGLAKNSDGYHHLKYKGKTIGVHNLAFILKGIDTTGFDIDHKNRKRDDNRWCNLRLVTHKQNMNNVITKPTLLPSGNWRARVGKEHIGVFCTKEEAESAINDFKLKLIGELRHDKEEQDA